MCRRNKYCTTDCKAHKAFRARVIRQVIAQSKAGKILGQMKGMLREAKGGKTEYLDEE